MGYTIWTIEVSSLAPTLPRPRDERSEEQPDVTFETRLARVSLEHAARLHIPLAQESTLETTEALVELDAALTRLRSPPTLRQEASEEVAREVSVDWQPEERLRGGDGGRERGKYGLTTAVAWELTIAQRPAASRQRRRGRRIS